MDFETRLAAHKALGDRWRLQIVDALCDTDLTFTELCELTSLEGNLLAHHVAVLESSGLATRRTSEGDARRRYLSVNADALDRLAVATARRVDDSILFVCTHNSARSQFAAAMWTATTGAGADSAGAEPSARVHPTAVRVAREFGIDLTGRTPQGYESAFFAGTVVSVCDRAKEAGPPDGTTVLHWSIPDPVADGSDAAFRAAFGTLRTRIERLAGRSVEPI